MVVPYIRLRKRRIDSVVRARILALRKALCHKLIVRLQPVDLGILRFDRSYILRKFCLIVLPEDKLTRISRKFGIQPLNDLF